MAPLPGRSLPDTTSGMQYLVYRAAGNLGPFSIEQLQQQVAAGTVRADELAWHEGLPQWQPVSTFLPGASPATSPATYAPAAGAASTGSAEGTRRAYLAHEQNVRSIGTYFCFSGGMQLFAAVMLAICGGLAAIPRPDSKASTLPLAVVAVEVVVFLILGGLTVWAGRLLRRLDRKAFVAGIIVAAIGLLGVPVGTLISVYILYLILCESGRFVLSDSYRAVVAATPEIQWKTALWVKILIGLIVLAFVSVVAISILLALGQTVHHVQQAAP